MRRSVLVILLTVLAGAQADERIVSFHSDILVRQDALIEVTETIVVRAEGQQIRRGIYRDYPTEYKDRFGNSLSVRYEPRSVLRNGLVEDFHTEKLGNGVRAYFGAPDRMISPGNHTYTYRYDAGRMLGFFADHDELYWNVTGNDTGFPIDSASATVSFDFEIDSDAIGVDAWTGSVGESGRNVTAGSGPPGIASFESTAGLPPYSGLTIFVRWPKGHVAEPGPATKLGWLLTDNLNLLIAVAGLLTMLAYYVPVWSRFGRDPQPGVIFPRYSPPSGYSPASLRYIDKMGYDDKGMTAAVVSLAVKGYLKIIDEADEHSLVRAYPGDHAPELATGERELLDALFRTGDSVILENTNHKHLSSARAAHRRSLKRDYANRYFRTNTALNIVPLVVGIVAALVSLKVGSGPTVFVLVTIAAMVLVLLFFAIVMKQPTGLGRKLMDEVAGFREYLDIAEKDEMNLRNPPEKTPQLFEQYLPFALALGVEQRWAERFAAVFASIRNERSGSYQPAWYHGSWHNQNPARNISGLSSGLTSAISSSMSAPGSASGSGGFSGGGGGGGGVGGW